MAQADQKQVDSEVSFVDFLQMSGFPPPPPQPLHSNYKKRGEVGRGFDNL